jgi:hypothetical protein
MEGVFGVVVLVEVVMGSVSFSVDVVVFALRVDA